MWFSERRLTAGRAHRADSPRAVWWTFDEEDLLVGHHHGVDRSRRGIPRNRVTALERSNREATVGRSRKPREAISRRDEVLRSLRKWAYALRSTTSFRDTPDGILRPEDDERSCNRSPEPEIEREFRALTTVPDTMEGGAGEHVDRLVVHGDRRVIGRAVQRERGHACSRKRPEPPGAHHRFPRATRLERRGLLLGKSLTPTRLPTRKNQERERTEEQRRRWPPSTQSESKFNTHG